MKRRLLFVFPICLLILAAGADPPRADEWVENGIAVCTEPGWANLPQVVTYPEGLYFFTWMDGRNGVDSDIYALAVGGHGGEVGGWYHNGTAVCTTATDQDYPQMVPDGNYGAIIAWRDFRSGLGRGIYAQRIDAGGNSVWATNGVPVVNSPPAYALGSLEMIPDGEGGAIMVWQDTRSDTWGDMYAQKIDFNGTPLWTANGVPLCTVADIQSNPQLVSDGNGGAIFTWEDRRTSGTIADIYAQRVDAGGTVLWATDGELVCGAANGQTIPGIVSDGQGGAIITWQDGRDGPGSADIYAQRISPGGSAVWTVDGEPVSNEVVDCGGPAICSDGDHGAIIAWSRDDPVENADIYAQRMDKYGDPVWTANGVPVYATPEVSVAIRIDEDGDGGGVLAFYCVLLGVSGSYDIKAQRIDGAGNLLWGTDGLNVVDAPYVQWYHEVASDGAGGMVAVWEDQRSGSVSSSIYAQRIERNGYWGYPAPNITAADDVPGDQGGSVYITWDASRLDAWPEEHIFNYTVWRAINTQAAMSLVKGGSTLLHSVGEFDPKAPGRFIREQRVPGFTPYYWEYVSTVYAYKLEKYGETVETLSDSTAVSDGVHYFQVIAHSQTGEYWISDPGSGYSVDNLAPATPLYLSGEQSVSPAGLVLSWWANSEEDLAGYAVYRGTDASFVPGPANRIDSPDDTTTTDTGWAWNGGYYYKVSALDIHGNESGYALLEPDQVTGAGGTPVPAATYLAQNYPNPFRRSTSITFGLAEEADVSLRVYDVQGRLVRVLADGRRDARVYEVEWDGRDNAGERVASGVYFCYLKAGSRTHIRKALLLR